MSIKLLWKHANKTSVAILAALLISVIGAEIVLTVVLPFIRTHLVEALELKNATTAMQVIYVFAGTLAGLGAVQGVKMFLSGSLALQVRRAGTNYFVPRWSKTSLPESVRNYTQAQTQALQNASAGFLENMTELLISGGIVVSLVLANTDKPVILAAAAVFSALLIAITFGFARPMIQSNHDLQSAESTFTQSLFKLARREITIEDSEVTFSDVKDKIRKTLKVSLGFTFFSRFKGAVSTLIPYILLFNPLMRGEISLGEYMGHAQAFELIVINAAIIAIIYPRWTQVSASWRLIAQFDKDLKNAEDVPVRVVVTESD